MRNTKAGIKNPYWRHKGFWEWRRREITALNRRMRKRKHIFPRRDTLYLPSSHPFLSACSSPILVEEEARHLFGSIEIGGEESNEANGLAKGRRKGEIAKLRRKPGGFLHDGDRNKSYTEDMRYLSPPRKGEGRVWVAKRRDIPMGKKRLLLLLRLIKGLQLTDAIDWLQALALHRSNPLINVLLKQQRQIVEEGADASRVYVQSYIIGPAGHIKTLRVGHSYRVSFLKSYRYSLSLLLRELPLHELFHKTFILKQPPRCLTSDMRLALRQQQLPLEAVRDWVPYLDAPTRYSHKRSSIVCSNLKSLRHRPYHPVTRSCMDVVSAVCSG
ncbi:hypothetical protein cyc_03122 [Cyclospora cayetanensis]|uniref:Ribosomal protein n=1 Tax=Cyclospora cayetanensis TaxID=88456 RepID=A0A1D3CZ31_9EIME|nr:hypothetical protein cyc_03122 [Cyclospora cayetanensis]